jgi:hypothetical protein
MQHMAIPNIIIGSHPAARFLAGCSLLIAAIICHSLWLSFSYLILSVCLIFLIEGGWLTIIRMLKLLRWFIIPIILLHALLSPGELIMPGVPVPVTWEGVNQGFWLSLHLSTIFAAALLLSRVLKRSEWMRGVLHLPFVSKKIIVFQMMMVAMKTNITEQLRHLKCQWKLRSDWRMAAVFLLAAFRMALAAGREQARMLWLRWPATGNGMHLDMAVCEQDISHSWMLNLVWLCAGFAVITVAWL